MASTFLRLANDLKTVSRGTTVPLQAIITDPVGNLIASGVLNNLKCHIHDPNWTIVASGISYFDAGSDGLFYSDWQSPVDSILGRYTVVAFWQLSGKNYRVARSLFSIQDVLS